MSSSSELTPQQLVLAIKAKYEMSWDDLGATLGRSARMMRKVARGETSGAAYKQALVELHERGQVQHVPARRRNAAGELVSVRAKKGAEHKLVTPQDLAGRFKDSPKRGRFAVQDQDVEPGEGGFADPEKGEVYFPEGGRMSIVDMPKTRRAKGRKAGMDALMAKVRNAAKSQRRSDKRIRITAEFDIGGGKRRVVEIGHKAGYAASDIVADVRKLHGGSIEDWVNHQVSKRYPDFEPGAKGTALVRAHVTVFNATRSKEERKELDESNARRWNRDAAGQRIIDSPRGNRRARGRKSSR